MKDVKKKKGNFSMNIKARSKCTQKRNFYECNRLSENANEKRK